MSRVRVAAGDVPVGADRLLLPDAGLGLRGRGRRAGHLGPRLARLRPVRRALRAAVLAVPDRDERLPEHARQRQRRVRPMDLGPPGPAAPPTRASRVPRRSGSGPVPDSRVLPGGGDPADWSPTRVDPAGVRRRAAAPAAAAAGRADPARGAGLVGPGGRRPARHLGAASTARCNGPGPPSPPPTPPPTSTSRWTTSSRRCSPATWKRSSVRPRGADDAAARGRDAVDAAVRCGCAAATTSPPGWPVRAVGCRGSRLVPTVANGMPAFGQYRPRPRRLRPRPVGADRAGDLSGPDRRRSTTSSTPPACSRSSGCRPAWGNASVSPSRPTSSSRSGPAPVTTRPPAVPPRGQAQPGQRLDRHHVGADHAGHVADHDAAGPRPRTSSARSAHRTGMSARVIVTPMAKEVAEAVMRIGPGGIAETHRLGADRFGTAGRLAA